MHPALEVEDILVLICSSLNDNSLRYISGDADVRSLAAFARCSKVFVNPALSRLWANIDLRTLLLVLPTCCENPEHEGAWLTLGYVDPQAWTRFRAYAERVRTLYILANCRVQEGTFSTLAHYSGNQPLLPSLRRLHCFRWTLKEIFPAKILIPPTLLSIEILGNSKAKDEETDDQHVLDLLDHTLSLSASLEQIVLGGSLPAQLTKRLGSLSQLRDVTFSLQERWTDTDGFMSLSRLPHLSRLRLNVEDADLAPPTLDISTSFRSLVSLEVAGGLEVLTWLFNSISSDKLSSVTVVAKNRYSCQQWRDCLMALRSRHQRTTRHFSLTISETELEEENQFGHDPAPLLEDLAAFSGLQTLYLMLHLSVVLHEEHLQRMARAWPAMEQLDFWCNPEPREDNPCITSLGYFASQCPHLTSVSLPMDATMATSIQPKAAQQLLPSHPLSHLFISGGAPIQDDSKVTHLLQTLFPHLTTLGVMCFEHRMGVLWQRVKRSLNVV
ncbi:hypothetical protein NM688_g2513 [Phlebia brevispora]|uniref:Uncharacterized protein n=1 Tax=Phlebia brevispora TaxID=194682 RepID=A0ACC1T8N3_9APHY|nr:hypothetical protein NM688_g2513 [Phlebia brevispora]